MTPRLFVDRMSDGVATLLGVPPLLGELTLPEEALPAGTREGDYLTVDLRPDPQERERARREVARLMDDLGDEP